MAVLFRDLDFPTELYNMDGSFTGAIQNLIDFSTRIADARLPKDKRSTAVLQRLNAAPHVSPPPPNHPPASHATQSTSWTSHAATIAQHVAPLAKEGLRAYANAAARDPERSAGDRRWDYAGERERQTAHERERDGEREKKRERERQEQQQTTAQNGRKRKHEKDSGSKARDKDEASDAEQSTDKSKQANSADRTISNILVPVAVAVTGGLVAAGSTWLVTRAAGHAQFVGEFGRITEEAESVLQSVKYWIRDRERLALPVPQVVVQDLRRLQELVDLCYRLDDSRDTWRLVPGYVATALGGMAVVTGVLMGGTEMAVSGHLAIGTIEKFGALGVSLGAVWIAGAVGLRSSPLYASSYEMYASRVIAATSSLSWADATKHSEAVLAGFASAIAATVEVEAPVSSERAAMDQVRARERNRGDAILERLPLPATGIDAFAMDDVRPRSPSTSVGAGKGIPQGNRQWVVEEELVGGL